MTDSSYYYCQHCRTEVCTEIKCPCCSLGNPPLHTNSSLLDDFFSWLRVHRAAREHPFHNIREKYDWGYIKACEVIEEQLKRIIREYRDGIERIATDTGILDEEIPGCSDKDLSKPE